MERGGACMRTCTCACLVHVQGEARPNGPRGTHGPMARGWKQKGCRIVQDLDRGEADMQACAACQRKHWLKWLIGDGASSQASLVGLARQSRPLGTPSI